MEENKVITTRKINKYFGSFHALIDLSITVDKGEVFGFIGKNGAGKTTFMRIICGLMKSSSGTVAVPKKIGFLPQNVRFHDSVSAQEIIDFFAKLRGVNIKEGLKFASELELEVKKTVRNLSPGQQRKLQIVIATIGLPELLVLDEPMAGLDPVGVQQVREVIRTLNKKGCTIFISSHALMELDNICSNVAIIEKGAILYQGLCNTVYEIETEGVTSRTIELLPDAQKVKCSLKGEKLFAYIERHEVPELLKSLYKKDIKVFSVKRQSLEALYNDYIKDGA
jgi:ABC-2 type transport system ATP-binding protein